MLQNYMLLYVVKCEDLATIKCHIILCVGFSDMTGFFLFCEPNQKNRAVTLGPESGAILTDFLDYISEKRRTGEVEIACITRIS